jgi:uncharacterized protein involved in response to NO
MNNTDASRLPWFSEPFRLFFPVGLFFGVVAVLQWPIWIQWSEIRYPLESHRFLMLQVYLGLFAMGFIGTAGPRLLGTAGMRAYETIPALLLVVLSGVCYLLDHILWGNLLFACAWFGWGLLLATRWRMRRDLPPPGVPLVFLTWLAGWGAPLLWALIDTKVLSIEWSPFWRVLQNQVYPAGMILGVGAFLLPRFWGIDSLHDFPEMRNSDGSWRKEFSHACVTSVLILLGCGLIAGDAGVPWNMLIALACTEYLLRKVRFLSGWRQITPLGWMARWSLLLMCAALWLVAGVEPQWEVAILHLLFMGGVSMLLIAVGSRVIWGHSGQRRRLQGSHLLVSTVMIALTTALIIRLLADIMLEWRIILIATSALVWVCTQLVWAAVVMPGVWKENP